MDVKDSNLLVKFADIFVTDSMQEYIRYRMVEHSLILCNNFIKRTPDLIVPDFIKHDSRDTTNDSYYIGEVSKPEIIEKKCWYRGQKRFNEHENERSYDNK